MFELYWDISFHAQGYRAQSFINSFFTPIDLLQAHEDIKYTKELFHKVLNPQHLSCLNSEMYSSMCKSGVSEFKKILQRITEKPRTVIFFPTLPSL